MSKADAENADILIKIFMDVPLYFENIFFCIYGTAKFRMKLLFLLFGEGVNIIKGTLIRPTHG